MDLDLLIFVPIAAIGKVIKKGGNGCFVVPAFIREHVKDWNAFCQSFGGPGRVLIRVKPEARSRFRKRATGPDNAYHGVWVSDDPLPPDMYELVA